MERKREERAWLDLLREVDPEFPGGRIVPGESPDFMIHTGIRSRIGVELTRLIREPTPHHPEWSFAPALTRELLEEQIRKKESKLRLYRKRKPDRLWLVLLTEGFSHSPSFNLSNQLEKWRISSEFDRVILLDLAAKKTYAVAG